VEAEVEGIEGGAWREVVGLVRRGREGEWGVRRGWRERGAGKGLWWIKDVRDCEGGWMRIDGVER